MSFNSGGTTLSAQFNLKSKQPIDGRYIITSKEEYDSMKSIALYPGLSFVVTSNFTDATGTEITKGFYKVDLDGETVIKQEQFPEPLIVTLELAADGITEIASAGANEILEYYRKGASVFLVYNRAVDELAGTHLCVLDTCSEYSEGLKIANFVCRLAEEACDINIAVYEDKSVDVFNIAYADRSVLSSYLNTDTIQNFTDYQKEIARNNLGIGSFIIALEDDQYELSTEDFANIKHHLEIGNTVLLLDVRSNRYFWLTHSSGLNTFQFTNIEDKANGLTTCAYTIQEDRRISYVEREYKHVLTVNINYQDPEVEDDRALISNKTAQTIYHYAHLFMNSAICVRFKDYVATLTTSSLTQAIFTGITTTSGNCEYFTITIDESGNASFTKQQLLTDNVLLVGEQALTDEEKTQIQKNIGVSTLVVTATQEADESGTAPTGRYITSHSASEIYNHISKGGFAVLDYTPLIAMDVTFRFIFSGVVSWNDNIPEVSFIGSGPDGSLLRINVDDNKVAEILVDPYVRYDAAQTLTEEQQLRAKENIAACGVQIITWEDDD